MLVSSVAFRNTLYLIPACAKLGLILKAYPLRETRVTDLGLTKEYCSSFNNLVLKSSEVNIVTLPGSAWRLIVGKLIELESSLGTGGSEAIEVDCEFVA